MRKIISPSFFQKNALRRAKNSVSAWIAEFPKKMSEGQIFLNGMEKNRRARCFLGGIFSQIAELIFSMGNRRAKIAFAEARIFRHILPIDKNRIAEPEFLGSFPVTFQPVSLVSFSLTPSQIHNPSQ